jgi:tetraprenyl-beta-curcumene synthase
MRSVASQGSRRRELVALAFVMTRFWLVVFPRVRHELRGWRRRARAIPHPALRAQALATLDTERLSAAGAALFAATTRRLGGRRRRALVRALVAYQVMCDYLDTLAEQPCADPIRNGAHLHRALADAVVDGPLAEYYRHHPARDDGGYLTALVAACRASCARLPAFPAVRAVARREAARNAVQGINHAPADAREPALRRWAAVARAHDASAIGDAHSLELAAAGSSSLAVLALIAAAADPATTSDVAERVRHAYFPWIGALSTLLDSVADRELDRATGELNFVSRYPTDAVAVARLRELTARALVGARSLPRGERHVVLVAGMIAHHASEAGAWLPASRPATRAVLGVADTALMAPLLTLLRGWRELRARRYSDVGAPCATPTPTGQLTPVPPSPQ